MRNGILLCLALAALPAAADHQGTQRVDRSLEGWPIDAFALVDQHGEPFTRERLLRRWTFALTGDTACSPRCSSALSALQGLTRRIYYSDAVLSLQVVFLSRHPGDTPAAIKAFLASWDKRWIGATGPAPTLERLADDLDLAAGRHGSALALINPQGMLHAVYSEPFDVPRLTADFLKARALYR